MHSAPIVFLSGDFACDFSVKYEICGSKTNTIPGSQQPFSLVLSLGWMALQGQHTFMEL